MSLSYIGWSPDYIMSHNMKRHLQYSNTVRHCTVGKLYYNSMIIMKKTEWESTMKKTACQKLWGIWRQKKPFLRNSSVEVWSLASVLKDLGTGTCTIANVANVDTTCCNHCRVVFFSVCFCVYFWCNINCGVATTRCLDVLLYYLCLPNFGVGW